MRRLTVGNIHAIILTNRISEKTNDGAFDMNAIYSILNILGLLAGIILARLSLRRDGAESYALQCQAF